MSDNADRSVYDKVIRAMLDEPVTLVLTNEEVSKLMLFISELTLGPYSPTEEEWKQMENVHGLPSADYYHDLFEKLRQFRDAPTSPRDK